MRYEVMLLNEVMLLKSEEGYAAHCPALPAGWSQGCTREEAVDNTRIAINEYLVYLSEKTAIRKKELLEASQSEGHFIELDEVEIDLTVAA